MATPSAAATWRWVLKMAVARPVSTGVMVAYVAAWRGMKAKAMNTPRVNIRPRIHQRSVVRSICVNDATVLATATQLHLSSLSSSQGPAAVSARVSAYHDVFAIAAVLAIGAALIALMIRDEDAAATMRSRRRASVPDVEPAAVPG